MAGVAASLVVIGALTLSPAGGRTATAPFFCFTCGAWLQDGLDNIALFAPLGLSLAAWPDGRPRGQAWVVMTGALVSLLVEGTQFALLPGRDPAAADLVANTLGTALGSITWRLSLWWPSTTVARRVLWPLCVAAGAFVMLPARWFRLDPGPGPYWVQLDPRRTRMPVDARLLEAQWNGASRTCCPDSAWTEMRASLAEERVVLRVRALIHSAPTRPGRLLSIWDDDGNVVAGIGVGPTSAWGTVATVGRAAGAAEVAVEVPLTRPLATGDTVELALETRPGEWRLTLASGNRTGTSVLRQAPVMSAFYVLPGIRGANAPVPAWRYGVLALPFLVLGLYVARAGRGRDVAGAVVGLLLGASIVGRGWEFPRGVLADVSGLVAATGAAFAIGRWWSTKPRSESHDA